MNWFRFDGPTANALRRWRPAPPDPLPGEIDQRASVDPAVASRTGRIARVLARMPAWAEFCLVLSIAFSVSLVRSFYSALGRWIFQWPPHLVAFSDLTLLRLLIQEAVTFAVVYGVARTRGWASTVFRFRVTWRWTAGGLLLWVGTLFATNLLYSLARANGYHPVMLLRVASGDVTLPFILAVSLINPVFEEFLESGYVITMLSRFGMWAAVLSSALLRACLHLYQGDFQAVVIFVLGLIFGFTYWRWRRLWPLILAHALMDFFGLLRGNIAHSVHVIH